MIQTRQMNPGDCPAVLAVQKILDGILGNA